MSLEILKHRQNWRYVRLPDGHVGWVNQLLLYMGGRAVIRRWEKGPKVMVTSPVALILSRRHHGSIPVSDAVIGTELLLETKEPRWNRVILPDHRQGWIAKKDTSDTKNIIHLEGGRPQEILITARSFTGFPYLWGGTTPKGFDCSGYVQTVFRLNGVLLPRDAYQQFTRGVEVHNRDELRPADLLFFRAPTAERMTHVAIHIAEGQFIHCSGYVRTNSLNRTAEDYDASLVSLYAGAKRVVGDLASQC